MKRIKNTLVVPFWAQHFATLRTCENVNNGHFRIGQLILETQINNCMVIVAKITSEPKPEIQNLARELSGNLSYTIQQFEDGHVCAKQFIDEVAFSIQNTHNDSQHSECMFRLPTCGSCPSTKLVGDAEHEARELSHYEWLNANRSK
jgi:hypothetical protein